MKAVAIMAVLVAAVCAQEKPAAEPKVVADGANVKVKHVEGLHKVRFIEIFLAYKDAKTGKLVAECYNPLFTSAGIPATKDPVPNDLVAGIDLAKVKEEYGVLGASLNGPKLWLADWVDNDTGVERDFNGIKTVWVAQLDMGHNTGGVSESTPYKPMAITRNTVMGWNKGTTVLILDDAEGNAWVMKGFQLGLEPKYTYEEFVAAGQSQFKKLPPGWKFRVKTLEQDLIEKPEGGVAAIMPDEFFNIYDKTGPGMTNYKP